MIDRTYYCYVNVITHSLVKDINEYLYKNIENFYVSPHKQVRLDITGNLKNNLEEIFSFFPISDMGIFQNYPNTFYPLHKDTDRQFAINMLLNTDSDFDAGFLDVEVNKISPIPYICNQFLIINTKKFHYIKNRSTSKSRFCVSIGCTDIDYNKGIEILEQYNMLDCKI